MNTIKHLKDSSIHYSPSQPKDSNRNTKGNNDEQSSNKSANEDIQSYKRGAEHHANVSLSKTKLIDVELTTPDKASVLIATSASFSNKISCETEKEYQFYALRKGKSTRSCIYFRWVDLVGQLEDFPAAQYEGFNHMQDAVDFIKKDPHFESNPSLTASGVFESAPSTLKRGGKRKQTGEDAILNDVLCKQARCVVLEEVELDLPRDYDNSALSPEEDESVLQNDLSVTPLLKDPPAYISVYKTNSWDMMYQSLQTYHKKSGNTNVPVGSQLGDWVAQQRKEYKKKIAGKESKLTQLRVNRLQCLNFVFTNSKKALKFELRVRSLMDLKQKSGSIDPPSSSVLYKWVYNMRKKYKDLKEGKTVTGLDHVQIQRLEDIGFSWTSVKDCGRQHNEPQVQGKITKSSTKNALMKSPEEPSKREQKWNEFYNRLRAYKEEHGDFVIPHGNPLSRWASAQRKHYRKYKNGDSSTFNEAKFRKMQHIDFDFDCKRGRKGGETDDAWNEMYEEMKKFRDKHGHCIPHTQPSTPLRRWVDKQRTEYKKIRSGQESFLTLHRIQRLNDIGFSFEAKCKPKTWEERYEELVQFKAKFGHCKVPRLYNGLGKWVADQRQKYSKLTQGKKTNMTHDKAQKLTDLGMIWVVFKLPPAEQRAERKPWIERFKQLLAFKEKHGHTIVPQHYPVLGHWVHTQRVHYKLMKQGRKSLMTPEQAFHLSDIGFAFEVMPRKKNTVRQSLGNPYPHLPLIASGNETAKREQLSVRNDEENKEESSTYGIVNTFDEYSL